MPRLFCFLIALLITACGTARAAEHNTLSADELTEGWILLFDGETTYGWQPSSEVNWSVAEGVISASEGAKGLLCTTTQFGDYTLKVDFRSESETNSGVFLHTPRDPQDPAADCYELNIAPESNPFPTGSLVGRKKADASIEAGKWHTFEVTISGGKVSVACDGQSVLEYTDEKPLGRGYIGLQYNQGKIEFRNIKLKPLGAKSMFNGKDLTGWKTDQALESVITVTPAGELNIKNGKGQVESEAAYGDFVLQLEVFCNGKELNSGVFFRSIPGEFWNGYESQIHNGMVDGDPKRPNNGGTGGIFRRQEARRIVAKDFEWFTKTIVADGPHMAVWVNGIQVSDWTDTRKPHDNPRNGLRLEPGTIILQGHDPTTDLSFRNFRIAELPPRP